MASKCVGRQISTAGKRKYVTLITWLGKWWKPKCGYSFIPCWIVNCIWYKETEGRITITDGTKWKCEGLSSKTL